MDEATTQDEAIELLQNLGLQLYEAKAFVALTRLPRGTAKEISDVSEVPRTRVYDAVRVLESKGLVEIQHSNPQQFRAVPIDEAADTLLQAYEKRTESLQRALRSIDAASLEDESDSTHEVWSLSGREAITSRTQQLIGDAEDEILFVVGDESVFSDELETALRDVEGRGVSIVVGTVSETVRAQVQAAIPEAAVFVSGLEWLNEGSDPGDNTQISRLLLVDESTILVSTFHTSGSGDHDHEQAVFGKGFENGLVTIARRLMATGLFSTDDPGT